MQFSALLLFMQLKGNHNFVSTWFIPWYFFAILEDFSMMLLQTVYPNESQKSSQFEELCFSLTSLPGDSLLFWDYLYQLECKSIVFWHLCPLLPFMKNYTKHFPQNIPLLPCRLCICVFVYQLLKPLLFLSTVILISTVQQTEWLTTYIFLQVL